MPENTSTALARARDDLAAVLARWKPAIANAIPGTLARVMTPERLLRIAHTAVTRTPDLLACSKESIVLAVIGAASLGLDAGGPLGHAYLVPYGREATLIIGYRGLLEIARRTGDIRGVRAHVVRQGDDWDFELGLTPRLKHVPRAPLSAEVIAAYAVIDLRDGGQQVEVMTREEIDAIRARSRAGRKGPWVTDFCEMARKTVLRRALKYAPQSTELASAMSYDGDTPVAMARPLSEMMAIPDPRELHVEPTDEPVEAMRLFEGRLREAANADAVDAIWREVTRANGSIQPEHRDALAQLARERKAELEREAQS